MRCLCVRCGVWEKGLHHFGAAPVAMTCAWLIPFTRGGTCWLVFAGDAQCDPLAFCGKKDCCEYGVAATCRLRKSVGLFCNRDL